MRFLFPLFLLMMVMRRGEYDSAIKRRLEMGYEVLCTIATASKEWDLRFFSQPDWLFADLGARYCDDEAGAIFGCKALSNTPAGVAASTSRCRGRVPSFSDGLSHHLNRTGKYLPGSFCSILIILADELVGSTRAETCATSPSRARCRLANGLSV